MTYPISRAEMQAELSYFVDYFTNAGFFGCKIYLGFAWMLDYYAGDVPTKEHILLAKLETKVRHLENADFGHLGADELFVDVADVSFRFCDESDIHIYFDELTPNVEHFVSRWQSLGYQPNEHVAA